MKTNAKQMVPWLLVIVLLLPAAGMVGAGVGTVELGIWLALIVLWGVVFAVHGRALKRRAGRR